MTSNDLFQKLIEEGKLKTQKTNVQYLNNLIHSAKRNFDASSLIKGKIDEAAFKLCYDGLLQIGRVILLLNGFRPDDGEQHKTTFFVAGKILGPEYLTLIKKIQKYRIKRNNCIYDPKIFITKAEAENIHKTAQKFWSKVRIYLSGLNSQLELFDELK
ncbi:MAG: hypothetical protein R6V02_05740 [Candidatus Aminicenantes bacterium]